MSRYYIGLANTVHDPAIAIVGPDGEVLFAARVTIACLDARGRPTRLPAPLAAILRKADD